MNSLAEHLNSWGAAASRFAWPMFWQSSLLIAFVLILDWALGRKLRPGFRYALWMVVLVKLVLPPSLALPSGVAWWVRPHAQTAHPVRHTTMSVTYGDSTPRAASTAIPLAEIPKPELSVAGGLLGTSFAISLGLLGYLLFRWRQVSRQTAAGRATEAPVWLVDLADTARRSVSMRRRVRVRMLSEPVSPALFGLFRPVILLPEALVNRLTPEQLHPVLLHELIHLKRKDVWINCAQTLLQILYWWHPLVWVANHRIRRVREEAVDEAVMLALRGDAVNYAPTLLEVARLALPRPLASLGLIGILESHAALRQRIERLVDFRPPRSARVGLVSILSVTAFAAVALPMGQAPEQTNAVDSSAVPSSSSASANNPAVSTASTEAKALVQDGKLLYEMGKLDEAEKQLSAALQKNPREQAAYYYLSLIKEARSNKRVIVPTSPGRKVLLGKLERTGLASVEFDNVPLADVVKFLVQQVRLSDPESVGINILLNPGGSEPQLNPNTGLLEATPSGQPDLARMTIRIKPALTNVRLLDVLDAIVKVADVPIKYAIEDYAVVFSLKGDESVPLYTRVFKVDPNSLIDGINSVLGESAPTNRLESVAHLSEFVGVDLHPPKSVYFKDRDGSLLVRATRADLDAIETAIGRLSATSPQLVIKAQFLELSEAGEAAFWIRHNGGKRGFGSVRFAEIASEELQREIEVWKSSNNTQLLSESMITTLSGRQAQIQTTELKTIVVATNSTLGSFTTQDIPLGPILDVLPTVSADTFRINLILTASIKEFLGYDDPARVPMARAERSCQCRTSGSGNCPSPPVSGTGTHWCWVEHLTSRPNLPTSRVMTTCAFLWCLLPQ